MIEYFGYQGHFICKCDFHLTTVVRNDKQAVMVSTVGKMFDAIEKRYLPCGAGRLFETYVFAAIKGEFWEADVSKALEGGRYYTIQSDIERKLLDNMLSQKEVNDLFNELEKQADKGHKEAVEYWEKKLNGIIYQRKKNKE